MPANMEPMSAETPVWSLAEASAVVAGASRAVVLSPDGEVERMPVAAAGALVRRHPPVVCHARALARRLGVEAFPAFDVLELFAFVRPAAFCLPTPKGLALALELPPTEGLEGEALTLLRAVRRLLGEIGTPGRKDAGEVLALAAEMGKAGWAWAGPILSALNRTDGPSKAERAALRIWARLPEWEEGAPLPPPGQLSVDPEDARRRLAEFLAAGGPGEVTEPRPQQADYAGAVSAAFTPRTAPDTPNVVLAEAGTGVGKTLGYLASATVWAERNGAPVWISTYTRNLQHQIEDELARLYPDPVVRAEKVVVRKGRENYLCLLNLEDAIRAMPVYPRHAVAVGLMARWVGATRDGDLTGGDFPGWLVDLVGRAGTLGLADRRGECVFSACDHWSRCFIERSVRRAKRADIVIANHALVLISAALGGGDDGNVPGRYVFDEGHHVFDAADSAFSGELTGAETRELRRWLLGAEEGGRGRARGLKRRLEDLIADDEKSLTLVDEVTTAARVLPGEGWIARVLDMDEPKGPTEKFLFMVRTHVHARAEGQTGPHTLETPTAEPIEGLPDAARELAEALERLVNPLTALSARLEERLDDEAADLNSDQRRRLDSVARSLKRRGVETTTRPWIAMLRALETETPPAFVDWFEIERRDGRDADVGLHRHWIDPTIPLAEVLAGPAHGVLVTSATLTDGTGDPALDWAAAEARTGAAHLPKPAIRATVPSPFDYANHTRVMVVNDVRKDDLAQVASAYRELFLAAGGGGLGLFTAISRLRAVWERIVDPLDAAGLPLHAQHVDPLDVATLIDIFRGEERACLLGTDAVRDGVDVPGRSLRLIVFDRVPWPRPDLLHRARRDAFGRRRYEDMITRLRLKQAFGRLVRRADDTGVFVLLDPMMPSRLSGAFPEGVEIRRVGLKEAVETTRTFLNPGQ